MINKDMHLQAIHIILSSHFNFRMLYSPVESTLARIMEKLDHDMKYESDHDRNCPSEFPGFAERIALLEERVGKPKLAFAGIN